MVFVVAFFVMLVLIIKRSMNQSARNKKHEKYVNSINNIDRLMNNKPHTTNEIELVDALRGENIVYRGVE